MFKTCHICGEEIEHSLMSCPYCLSEQNFLSEKAKPNNIKVINIKEDQPFVDEALMRFHNGIENSKNYKVVKIIHGYGSSGVGGEIKTHINSTCSRLVREGKITSFIKGEDFHRFNTKSLELIKRYTFLKTDKDFNQKNKGISLIIL